MFLVFAALLAAALLRRRADAPPRGAPTDAAEASKAARPWLVGGGVVLPVVVITAVLVATLATMRGVPGSASAGDLTIEVVGHRWWWEVRYPGAGAVTANEVHIPAGRRVHLRMRSADVIHSFWVPPLAGKIDLLPDRPTSLLLEADEPGRYAARCAEFCGLQHAKMDAVVVAHEPGEFSGWLAAQREPAGEPDGPEAARGAELFAAEGCGSCHTVRGTSADGKRGPDLTHVASRASIGAGTLSTSRDDLARWVADPHAVKEGVLMPPAELDGDELAAIVAYLEGLR